MKAFLPVEEPPKKCVDCFGLQPVRLGLPRCETEWYCIVAATKDPIRDIFSISDTCPLVVLQPPPKKRE